MAAYPVTPLAVALILSVNHLTNPLGVHETVEGVANVRGTADGPAFDLGSGASQFHATW